MPKRARFKLLPSSDPLIRAICHEHRDDSGLTIQERRFVGIFRTNGHFATSAYRTMHPKAKPSTCEREGIRIRNKPHVAAAIRAMDEAMMKKFKVTNERIMQELACLAFNDPGDYFRSDGSVKPIHEIPEEARRALAGLDINELFEWQDGERVFNGFCKKLKITNKLGALEQLVKIQGMITNKHELSADDDLAELLTKANRRRVVDKDPEVEELLG